MTRQTLSWLLPVGVLAFSTGARAGGLTQTLPRNTFVLDVALAYSRIASIWDNAGKRAPIVEEIERFEPGQGRQGVLKPDPVATYTLLVNQLQYGVTDSLTVGVGLPVVLDTTVDPNLGWEEGDYQNKLGRAYTEEDFWIWAETLGQSQPGEWRGNRGTPSDTILGARWRWSDGIELFRRHRMAAALSLMGAIPTGKNAEPEEAVSLGTSLWDLHTAGDLGAHLSVDQSLFGGDFSLGLDGFYEYFFVRSLDTPTGVHEPLLLTYSPYVGEHYKVKPGDFSGFAIQADWAAYQGEARQTWLTAKDPALAGSLPPLLAVSLQYRYVYLQQTDWRSEFPLWDWQREKYWRPGYKNFLTGRITVSWLRLGWPLQTYLNAQSLTIIPGRNCRAADTLAFGVQALLKFW